MPKSRRRPTAARKAIRQRQAGQGRPRISAKSETPPPALPHWPAARKQPLPYTFTLPPWETWREVMARHGISESEYRDTWAPDELVTVEEALFSVRTEGGPPGTGTLTSIDRIATWETTHLPALAPGCTWPSFDEADDADALVDVVTWWEREADHGRFRWDQAAQTVWQIIPQT
jgi:hypothetical protein